MKKLIFAAFICLVVVIACDFAIPQSLTVKGTPGVYLPVGRLDIGSMIGDHLNDDKIREMMGEDGDMRLYNYTGYPGNVQAYIVHYPITEMSLNLQQYIDDAMVNDNSVDVYFVIPEIMGEPPPSGDFPVFHLMNLNDPDLTKPRFQMGDVPPPLPAIKVELVDMARLVKEVNGRFGFEIPYDASLENGIEVDVPAFKFGGYRKGYKYTDSDGIEKLRFSSGNDESIKPQEVLGDGFLEIYIKIINPCSGVIEKPGIVFDWDNAMIDTSEEKMLEGEYTIENTMGDFLGEGVEFNTVLGYIYVDGIGNSDANMSLDLEEVDLLQNQSKKLTEASKPNFPNDINSGDLPPHSLSVPINLTQVLNSTEDSVLSYDIEIKHMEVVNTQDSLAKVISADLVIVIALEFKVTGKVTGFPDYALLDLRDGGESILPEPGTDDLFQRTGENDLLNNIDMVRVTLKDINNDIFNDDVLAVLLYTNDGWSRLMDFSSDEPSLMLSMGDLPNPFNPGFNILLRKQQPDHAVFAMKRQSAGVEPQFDFFLTLEAKADINYKIDF